MNYSNLILFIPLIVFVLIFLNTIMTFIRSKNLFINEYKEFSEFVSLREKKLLDMIEVLEYKVNTLEVEIMELQTIINNTIGDDYVK